MGVKSLTGDPSAGWIVAIPATRERVYIDVSERGEVRVLNDKCRHRGGPLHLCQVDQEGRLRCPWHGRELKKPRPSKALAVVAIASKNIVHFVRETAESSPDVWPVKQVVRMQRPGSISPKSAMPGRQVPN
ncbi:MAG: Rieske 2Fe-2S domain-containing protein [Proteobacteria bacterium]|nr:Rieske 2Fe-2S domain-containing protein [Pseudomonadota bacterium]